MDDFEEFDESMKVSFDKGDKKIIKYNKYIVVANKGLYEEEIYGGYDNELDAYKRLREVKIKNKTIVKANINYAYIKGVKFIMDYEEV